MTRSASYADHSSRGVTRWLWIVVRALAWLIALSVLFFATGTVRDPTASSHGMLGSMPWSTVGPHLVLLSVLSLSIAIAWRWGRKGALATALVAVALMSVVASTVITAHIVKAAYEAGGYANPISGLWLGSMTADEPDHVVSFVGGAGQPLGAAIYVPDKHRGPAPVLVYIHGGGFKIGSVIETSADLRWFANRGWLVISVDYRLWTEKEPTWDKAPEDVACALAWVNTRAKEYGGDLGRLALLGDSAGGNLAINLAYAVASGESACGESIPVPNAVVTQYPAVDPLFTYEHGYPIPGFEPKWLLAGYIGGDPYSFPERIQAVSSYSYLSSRAPQTLIIAPEKDGLVPAVSVYRFAEYARLAGVDIELVRIPFSNHVYNQLASNSVGNQARLSITYRYLNEKGLSP